VATNPQIANASRRVIYRLFLMNSRFKAYSSRLITTIEKLTYMNVDVCFYKCQDAS
jgi:hypothetical protein